MTTHHRRILELWEERHDPRVAIELLAIERDYVAAGTALPLLLARWRMEANDAATSVVDRGDGARIEHAQATAHLRALGLARSDNRPAKFVSKIALLKLIDEAGDTFDEAAHRKIVQARYGVSANTARDHIRRVKAAINVGCTIFGGYRLRMRDQLDQGNDQPTRCCEAERHQDCR